MENNIFNLAVAGVIITLIFIYVILYSMRKSKEEAKAEAKQFLEDLSDQMYITSIEIINRVDMNKFSNFETYQQTIYSTVYEGCWTFINKKLDSIKPEDGQALVSVMAKKFITREYVEKFVYDLLIQKDIPDTMLNIYGANAIAEMDENQDQELQKEFADNTKYVENAEEIELPVAEEPKHDKAEEESLNPQKDIDEEEFKDDDDSIEVINDYIAKIVDKNNRTRYYLVSDGKRKQVSKSYALESGLEIK